MSLWSIIRNALPVLALAGLLLAPLAQPAMAAPAPAEVGMGQHMDMADHDMMSMPDGMPCCPDDQKTDCAKHCPFMAACMVQLHSTVPAYGFSVPVMQASVIKLRDDRTLYSLSQAPPPRPPKA